LATAPTFVQRVSHTTANAGIITNAVTIASSAAGSLLVVTFGTLSTGSVVTSVTDNKGNTYASQISDTTKNASTFCYACFAPIAGVTTVTIVIAATANRVDATVFEFAAAGSNTWSLSVAGTITGINSGTTSASIGPSGTPSAANSVAVSWIEGNGTVISAGTAGWTGAIAGTNGWAQYKIKTTNATETATYTIATTAQTWDGGICIFIATLNNTILGAITMGAKAGITTDTIKASVKDTMAALGGATTATIKASLKDTMAALGKMTPGPLGNGITPQFIQSNNSQSLTGAVITCAYSSSNTAGNILVIMAAAQGASNAVVSIAGNTNTYNTRIASYGSHSNNNIYVFDCLNCHAGANTITLTLTSGTFTTMNVWEFHVGTGTWAYATSTFNDETVNTTTPSSGATGTLINVAANPILCSFCYTNGASVSAGTAGWTGAQTVALDWQEYKIVTSTATQTATFTTPSATSITAIGAWYPVPPVTILGALPLAAVDGVTSATVKAKISDTMASTEGVTNAKVFALLRDTVATLDGITAKAAMLLRDTVAGKAGVAATDTHLSKNIFIDTMTSKAGITTARPFASVSDAVAAKISFTDRVYALLADSVATHTSFTDRVYSLLADAVSTHAGVTTARPFASIADAVATHTGIITAQPFASIADAMATRAAVAPRIYALIVDSVSSHAGITATDAHLSKGLIATVILAKATVTAKVTAKISDTLLAQINAAFLSEVLLHDTMAIKAGVTSDALKPVLKDTFAAIAGVTVDRVRMLLSNTFVTVQGLATLSSRVLLHEAMVAHIGMSAIPGNIYLVLMTAHCGIKTARVFASIKDLIAEKSGMTTVPLGTFILLSDVLATKASLADRMFVIKSVSIPVKVSMVPLVNASLKDAIAVKTATQVRLIDQLSDLMAVKAAVAPRNYNAIFDNFHVVSGLTSLVSKVDIRLAGAAITGITLAKLADLLGAVSMRAKGALVSAPVFPISDAISVKGSVSGTLRKVQLMTVVLAGRGAFNAYVVATDMVVMQAAAGIIQAPSTHNYGAFMGVSVQMGLPLFLTTAFVARAPQVWTAYFTVPQLAVFSPSKRSIMLTQQTFTWTVFPRSPENSNN